MVTAYVEHGASTMSRAAAAIWADPEPEPEQWPRRLNGKLRTLPLQVRCPGAREALREGLNVAEPEIKAQPFDPQYRGRVSLLLRLRAAKHELSCTECRASWKSCRRRVLGDHRGFEPLRHG